MDGQSRQKLVNAGYRIFRMRDIYSVKSAGLPPDVAAKPILQIREMSREKGEWGLYGTYPTKAARERAWKELAKGAFNIMEPGGEL